MIKESKINQLALVILDGVGQRKETKGNALKLAKTPNLDKFEKIYPSILMNASGEFVGLPDGQMGNSEVGHQNIGAGRIINQSLLLINKTVNQDKLRFNSEIIKSINFAKKNNSTIHIIGLISDGGVHSHINHAINLCKIYRDNNLKNYVHAFTDGRDTNQKNAKKYIKMLEDNNIKIATIIGRFYAMDRNKKWDRTQKAYDLLVKNQGISYTNIYDFIDSQYHKNVFDEYLDGGYNSNLNIKINDNDVIVFFNFRSDRARQLSHLFYKTDITITGYKYDLANRLKNILLLSMEKWEGVNSIPIFKQEKLKNILGTVLEKHHLRQLRAAETEKYPHVTFFFDGGEEIPKAHETRIIVPSPNVISYDLKPEMSSKELTTEIIKHADDIDVFIINYAQTDMVGHTGILEAAIKAVESADNALERLYEKIVIQNKGVMMIVADHGNVDIMINENGTPCTTHTTNPVQLIITSNDITFKNEFKDKLIAKLADLAPTMLYLLNIEIPKEMTGKVLIKGEENVKN